MKDQNKLLKDCLNNSIPVIVFQGTDSCAVEILQAAEAIYRKNGCSTEFLTDFHNNVLKDFQAYQQEEALSLNLPDINDTEREFLKYMEEKNKNTPDLPEDIADFEKHLKMNGFYQTNDNIAQEGKYVLINNNEYCSILAKNGDYDFAINYGKDTKNTNYYLFSNDTRYPERIGDYISFKNCYSDVMYRYPLGKSTHLLTPIIKQYRDNGYENIAKAIEQYSSTYEQMSRIGCARYSLEDAPICQTESRSLKGNIILFQKGNTPISQITNLRITDKYTGITEPLNIKDIDVCSHSSDQVKELLSGKKIELKNSNGISLLTHLNKTVSGWGISLAKQTFNSASSAAEI